MFRAAADDDDEFKSSQFEDDLAMMDNNEDEAVVVLGDGPENQQTSQKWARPDLPSLNPKIDAVVFQQMDVDNYIGQPMAGMPGAQVSLAIILTRAEF